MLDVVNVPHFTDYLIVSSIGNNIINSDIFKCGANQTHHGKSTVANHSIGVAMMSARIGLFLYRHGIRVDLNSLIKSALLHDLGIIGRFDGKFHGLKECCLLQHPKDSVDVAKSMFGELNEVELSSIKVHMFPFCFGLPIYRESWILILSDKIVSISEVMSNTNNNRIDWSRL